ncbi:hypothetical protein FNV43_RR05013 [Rhamnella rubrinervis]|uniref:Uncharacterized protein n=1 Tax=Rhamnella rubrinervis TaxID=2594499 RepID=A0A8K0MR63_9ROSA|nr:hypothetical protein FNV43_RR05013 [Rhamnella rubrinervis]
MKQAYKNACMGLIPKADPTSMATAPHCSTLSYIITIPIPHSKLRIKIPKLLLKTMQRRVHKDVDPDPEQTRNKKKRTENFLLRKAGCIFTNINVFGNKKSSPQDTLFKNGNNDAIKDVHGVCHDGSGIETEICEDDHDHDHQPFEVEQEFSSSEFHSAKKTLEGTDDEGSEEMRSNLSPKGSLPLAYLFNEEKSMNFNIKSKTSTCGFISNKENDNAANGAGGIANSLRVVGESSRHLIRIPSRISTSRSRRRLRIAVFVRKIESKKFEEQNAAAAAAREESGDRELCKKRILMGSKCKPLNLSGTLQYDSNGILLPEALGN